ncbi:MAG TPA: hypothetical protein VF699_05290 [Caulobacteraceae bacterium]
MTEPERATAPGAALGVWREAPSLHGRRTAAIGAFSCDDAESGAALLREVCAKLASEGFEAVVGPMDGDTWGSHRLVVESDGRAPFFLEPQNPAHYPAAFDGAGFEVVGRYLSAEGLVADRQARSSQLDGITVRTFDPSRAEAELRRLHAVSLAAFADNFLYRPIDVDAFLELYRPVVPLLDPELVLMAENEADALQGFLFGVPDFAQGPQPDSVVLKTYASLRPGCGSLLTDAFYANVRRKPFTRVVHALMHESNLSAGHSSRSGGRVFRRYALWGKRL